MERAVETGGGEDVMGTWRNGGERSPLESFVPGLLLIVALAFHAAGLFSVTAGCHLIFPCPGPCPACEEGACTVDKRCEEGWSWLVGKQCEEHEDCWQWVLWCDNGQCRCPTFVTDCPECADDADCVLPSEAACLDEECYCGYEGPCATAGQSCSKNSECADEWQVECIDVGGKKRCACTQGPGRCVTEGIACTSDDDCRDTWGVDCVDDICICTQGPGSCETGCDACEVARDCAAVTELYVCEAKIEVCSESVPTVQKDSDACARVGCPADVADACPLPEGDAACEKEGRVHCLEPFGLVDLNQTTTMRWLYCAGGGAIENVDPEIGEVLGATIVRTRRADRDDARESFLTLVLRQTMDVYVAYDSQADKKPDWLEGKGTLGQELGFAKLDGQLATSFQGDRRFDVYRKRDVSGKLVLPGNAHGGPTWSIPDSQRGMYFVMLKPRPGPGVTCDGIGESYWEGCAVDEIHARDKAESECEKTTQPHPWYRCGEPSCEMVFDCPDAKTQKQQNHLAPQARSYERRSEVDFEQPMAMTVDKQSRTIDVTGHLDFEFPPDPSPPAKPFVKINGLHGAIGEIGDYDGILLALTEPAYAVCQDPSPSRPCASYLIPKNAFRLLLAASSDGRTAGFSAGRNRVPLPLTIDKPAQPGQKRTFTIEGPVVAPVIEDGTAKDLAMDLRVTGTFTNFEPQANALESDRWAACARERSSTFVQLIALSDADVDETPTFKWYGDFGRSTHRLLGSGSQVSLPPGTFAWGVHHITLVVADLSVTDTESFDVRVVDNDPPTLIPPPDVLALATASHPGVAPGPITIDLGKPQTADACSLVVSTFNDAPEGNLFPPGITDVTWYADDNHGNVTEAKNPQRVLVYGPSESPKRRLRQLGAFFHTGIARLQETIASCPADKACDVDLRPLRLSTRLLRTLLGEIEDGGRVAERRQLRRELQQARSALADAGRMLGRSNRIEQGGRRQSLRQTAAQRLDRAGIGLKTIVGHGAAFERRPASR